MYVLFISLICKRMNPVCWYNVTFVQIKGRKLIVNISASGLLFDFQRVIYLD